MEFLSSDLRVFDEWECIPMMTPPFLGLLRVRFWRMENTREEGGDGDGDTADGRLSKGAQQKRVVLISWMGLIELHLLAGPINPHFGQLRAGVLLYCR